MKKVVIFIVVILMFIGSGTIGFRMWQDEQNAKNAQYEINQKVGEDGLPLTAVEDVAFKYNDIAIKEKALPNFGSGKECEVMDIPQKYHDTQAYKDYVKYLEEAKHTERDANEDINSLCLIIQELHGLYLVENEELKNKIKFEEESSLVGYSSTEKEIPIISIFEFNEDDYDFNLDTEKQLVFDQYFVLHEENKEIQFSNKSILEKVVNSDLIVLYEHPNTFDVTWQEVTAGSGTRTSIFLITKEGYINEKRPFLNERIQIEIIQNELHVKFQEQEFILKVGEGKRFDAPNSEGTSYVSIIYEGIYNTKNMTYSIEVNN